MLSSYCSGLTSITIPNSVTSIGECAFRGCSGLTALTIPEDLSIIRKGTFYSCNSLKEVVIPAKVEYIYQEVFASSLEKVKVLATNPPFAYDNTFSNYYIPLYVPEASINDYQSTNPWSKFSSFKTLSGDDVTVKTCAKPTISYQNGQITFGCETEGVEYVSNITDSDIKGYNSAAIQLSVTYNITVHATKSGYQNSETATATLCWIDQQPQTEGITDGVANVPAQAVLIQSDGGMLTVQGADDGTQVGVYTVSGTQAGSAVSRNGIARVATSLQPGSIAIVKVGQKSVKVAIK